jgi:hypothetical protein
MVSSRARTWPNSDWPWALRFGLDDDDFLAGGFLAAGFVLAGLVVFFSSWEFSPIR